MVSFHITVVSILALFCLVSASARVHTCSEAFLQMASDRKMRQCKKLNTLGAEFGWSNNNESRIDIFFGARLDSEEGWLAWGVNPQAKPQMVGTRALIGIKQSNGSLAIQTYNVTIDTKLGCKLQTSSLGFEVPDMKFEYWDRIQYYTISASLVLPSTYNISRLNHVWQSGRAASGWEPKMHPTTLQNVDSMETIDLRSGRSTQSVAEHRHHLRVVHGVLNILGWGMLLPAGVIMARYFRKFPVKYQYWYRLHVLIQIVGYVIGTAGWAIGLWLGHASKHYSFKTHRILAIFIFSFTTLQMLALRLRPKATDDYRNHWNMYHHFLGYGLLALISVNIFQGIAILRPDQTWKWVYIGLLCLLVSVTLVMEIITWAKFCLQPRGQRMEENKPNTKNPK